MATKSDGDEKYESILRLLAELKAVGERTESKVDVLYAKEARELERQADGAQRSKSQDDAEQQKKRDDVAAMKTRLNEIAEREGEASLIAQRGW